MGGQVSSSALLTQGWVTCAPNSRVSSRVLPRQGAGSALPYMFLIRKEKDVSSVLQNVNQSPKLKPTQLKNDSGPSTHGTDCCFIK